MNIMDKIELMVYLSELFWSATTAEELDELRVKHRPEVKTLPRDCQAWLLQEWLSAKRVINRGGISDEEMEKQVEGSKKTTKDKT